MISRLTVTSPILPVGIPVSDIVELHQSIRPGIFKLDTRHPTSFWTLVPVKNPIVGEEGARKHILIRTGGKVAQLRAASGGRHVRSRPRM
jgi:hypothetical protein